MQIEQKKVRQANIFKVFFRIKQTFLPKKRNYVLNIISQQKIGDTSLRPRFNQSSQPLTIHRKALATVGTN